MPSWPEEWRGAVLFGDYTSGWIRSARTSPQGRCGAAPSSCRCDLTVNAVAPFDSGISDLVGIHAHPQAGAVYASRLTSITRYRWLPDGSQPPVPRIASGPLYGPAPLTVSFDASASSDPEGGTLTFTWDFGDGSPPATGVSVSHTYHASGAAGFEVVLTARDPGGAVASAVARVGVNDSPPSVRIASLQDGQLYPMDGETPFVLRAHVDDEVSGPGNLACTWRTTLHHDAHSHPEPPVEQREAVTVLSPIGCAPPSVYWYEISITATDPSGLSAMDSVRLFPDCEGRLSCFGDVDGDGRVGGGDLAEVLSWWQGGGPADVNRDGTVTAVDLAEVLSHWGDCPP